MKTYTFGHRITMNTGPIATSRREDSPYGHKRSKLLSKFVFLKSPFPKQTNKQNKRTKQNEINKTKSNKEEKHKVNIQIKITCKIKL